MVKCPQCGHENLEGAAFCDECGASLMDLAPTPAGAGGGQTNQPAGNGSQSAAASATPGAENIAGASQAGAGAQGAGKQCSQCGTVNGANDRFCFNCGSPLVGDASQQADAPAATGMDAGAGLPSDSSQQQASPAMGGMPAAAAAQSAQAAQPAAQPAPMATGGQGNARLVLDGGTELPLPNKPEILIGREDPVSGIFPEVDMTPHGGEEGGVSRRHVRILNQNGQFSIEDLNSTNYTFVNKQKLAPKTPRPLQDGDEVRLGRIAMTFRAG